VPARDGYEAVGLATSLVHYDLLVTDTVMPGPSGLPLARQLELPRTLLISGYEPDDATRALIEEAGVELLLKPFTATDFVAAIRRLLEAPTSKPH
jgi:CheY-like chemotaxis protein